MSMIPEWKYKLNDHVLFVDTMGWCIDGGTIKKICADKYPYYIVLTNRGAEINLGEHELFTKKKDAVREIIRLLKCDIVQSERRTEKLKGILSEYESANFQMRYMGEVLE